LPSYSVEDLVEISIRKAAKVRSIIADVEPLRAAYVDLGAATAVDSSGRRRAALDVLGNARLSENLVRFAEEERDFRLEDEGVDLSQASDEVLLTITAADVRTAVNRELDRAGKEQNVALSRPATGLAGGAL
jgi:hypothetical protein